MLSNRLKNVVSQVNTGNLIADIGTDHGYVPIYLIKNSIAKKAIAADISKGSCDKAKTNISLYRLNDKIDVRCGNGLEIIKDSEIIDTIIISGMGGLLTIDVLKSNEKAVKNANQLILQPQRDIERVRAYLHSINYKIINEEMLMESGKYYTIINAVKGSDEEYSEIEYYFGKFLLNKKSAVLKKFIDHEYKKINIVLDNISNNAVENADERISQLKHLKSLYEEALKCL